MSSLAYNLTNKLEWMGRRLRHIDDVEGIKCWISAMKDINCLLKEIDIKECKDTWKPWSKTERGVKTKLPTAEALPSKKCCRPPRVEVDGDIIDRFEPKALSKVRPPRVQVEGGDVDMFDHKAAVKEMLKKAEVLTETEVAGVAASKDHKDNIEIWRQGMLEHLKTENKPVWWWGSRTSGNFRILISKCASGPVRIGAVKEWRKIKSSDKADVGDFLHKELMKYYDKVK